MKRFTFKQIMLATVLIVTCTLGTNAQGIITTIAGNGAYGYSGDGGLAIAASFDYPQGVGVDVAGNIYIADRYNSRIRVISGTTGIINTYAGNGVFGLTGLGGTATAASIRYPDAIFVDEAGDVHFTDWYNDMAMCVHHHSGGDTLDGDCGDGHQGHTGDGGDAHSCTMEIPAAICLDHAGNKYIADYGNNCIRRVDAITNVVTTIANGTGAYGYTGDGGLAMTATFQHPSGIFLDNSSDGLLYVSDYGNNVIRVINLGTGTIRTAVGNGIAGYIGDGGLAMTAELRSPSSIFIDNSHNIFIADEGNNVIRKYNTLSGTITTVAGNGTSGFSGDGSLAITAQLNAPSGVAVDASGNLYIADMSNSRIRKVTYPSISTTNTANIISANNVSVYPNPSKGGITIDATSTINGNIELLNVVGEKVYNSTINDTHTTFNVNNLANGIYILNIKSATGNYTQRISLEK